MAAVETEKKESAMVVPSTKKSITDLLFEDQEAFFAMQLLENRSFSIIRGSIHQFDASSAMCFEEHKKFPIVLKMTEGIKIFEEARNMALAKMREILTKSTLLWEGSCGKDAVTDVSMVMSIIGLTHPISLLSVTAPTAKYTSGFRKYDETEDYVSVILSGRKGYNSVTYICKIPPDSKKARIVTTLESNGSSKGCEYLAEKTYESFDDVYFYFEKEVIPRL